MPDLRFTYQIGGLRALARPYGLAVIAVVLAVAGHAKAQPLTPLPAAPAGVQVTTEYGMEFSTISSPGNAGYPVAQPELGIDRRGRGAVAYEYRMGRTEVPAGEWVQFFNAVSSTPTPTDIRSWFFGSGSAFYWGAGSVGIVRTSGNFSTGQATFALNPDVPNAAMMPAVDIQWRMAALYCNWLHNGRQNTWDSLRTGAYDTGTWGVGPNNTVTDATSHLSGARFWIPTFDEWQKAAFWDPNRTRPGQGGWRQFPNGSDSPAIGGFPGEVTPNGQATTSAGIPQQFAFNGELLSIPLAAYGPSQSPWGLFDTSGGAAEWTEDRSGPFSDGTPSPLRLWMGPSAGLSGIGQPPDLVLNVLSQVMVGGREQDVRFSDVQIGLRIAASIPSPSGVGAAFLGLILLSRRSR